MHRSCADSPQLRHVCMRDVTCLTTTYTAKPVLWTCPCVRSSVCIWFSSSCLQKLNERNARGCTSDGRGSPSVQLENDLNERRCQRVTLLARSLVARNWADWSCAGVVASREAPKGLPVGVGTSTKDGSVHSTTQFTRGIIR